MERNVSEMILDAINNAGIKSAAALREIFSAAENKASAPADCLTARGRIEALFDEGTFMESGKFVRRVPGELDGGADAFEGVICGWGSVAGRLTFAFCQDYSRTKGALTEAQARKIEEIYRLAVENGAPVIGIFDSAGALLPEGVRALAGYSRMMNCVSKASGVIPQIAVVPGICAGSASVVAGMFDFIIISDAKGTLSFNAPFVLNNADAGKSEFVKNSGLAALAGKNDAECIAYARLLLSYLPMNNMEGTVEGMSHDDANRLIDISAYNASKSAADLIAAVADDAKYLELYAEYAQEMSVGFISLNGTVCGVVANNKAVNGGILTAGAARKAARMITFCDSFDIPVITILDSEGADVSLEAEASPYAAELAKLAFAYSTAKCAMITLIAGEAYGAHFSLMGAKALGADVVLALDSAKIGVMSAGRAVAFLLNDRISETVTRAELEAKWDDKIGNAVAAAGAGEVDDIIAEGEIRQRIAGALMMLAAKSKCAPSRRHTNMPL